MNRPSFTIQPQELGFSMLLIDPRGEEMLRSKKFPSYSTCEKFLSDLKVHMCFHSNFYRTKSPGGSYGFEIRTCWDELIATSRSFETREEREAAMQLTFKINKHAVFMHHTANMNTTAALQYCA